MHLDDLRRFARRDWSALADGKLAYWAEQYLARGSAPARHASALLFEHAQRVQPGFPTASDRAADLASHLEIRKRLDRAGRAFTNR